jgi:hypothetical protein
LFFYAAQHGEPFQKRCRDNKSAGETPYLESVHNVDTLWTDNLKIGILRTVLVQNESKCKVCPQSNRLCGQTLFRKKQDQAGKGNEEIFSALKAFTAITRMGESLAPGFPQNIP